MCKARPTSFGLGRSPQLFNSWKKILLNILGHRMSVSLNSQHSIMTKLSVCVPRGYRGSGGVAPPKLNLDTR